MLVLSRREGERIFIGNDIAVTIVRIAGGQVRIGIDAPKEIPIQRPEVAESIERGEDSLPERRSRFPRSRRSYKIKPQMSTEKHG